MARGVNKVILIGNLGNDPEVRYMPNGNAVATVSLATSESWKDKQTGETQERTEWHRVVFFNRLAEIVGEYLHKSSKLYVEGSLRTRKWQDKTGQDRYTTEIIGNEMQMLDPKGSGGSSSFSGQQQSNYGQASSAPASGSTSSTASQSSSVEQATATPASQDEFDDDIPF